MREERLDYKKSKYDYLMDNIKIFPVAPLILYTVPIPKDPSVNEEELEFYDRNYPTISITTLEFKIMVDEVAKALLAYGIKQGDIVTICHTNTPETIYMEYALNKIGAKPNYVYPNVTPEELKLYVEELGSKYLFILDDYDVRNIISKASLDKDVKIISSSPIEAFPYHFKLAGKLTTEQKPFIPLENETKWEEFMKDFKKIDYKYYSDYKENAIANYVHTSGTSGVPKAVKITNENDNQFVKNYETDGAIYERGKTCVQTIPQFVEFGKATNHMLLCNSVTTIMIPEMNPKNYHDLIRIFRPNYSFATPSHLDEMMKRNVDLSNAENYLFGGDGFSHKESKAIKFFKDNGAKNPPYQGYGATEYSADVAYTRPNAYKVGSVGKISGTDTKYMIVKPGTTTDITAPGVEGELCITGPGLTLGYAGDSEKENKHVYKMHDDGNIWLHTGDLMSFDEDGYLYFHGRLKNIIKRKSFAFGPDEIINAVMLHPNVSNCVVIPKYDSLEGEVPSCHFTIKENNEYVDYTDYEELLGEVEKLVNDNVQEFHRPTTYKIRESIPLTKNNKVDFNALKIEDTCMLYKGVLSANITSLKNQEYDYELDIILETKMFENESKENIIKNIENYIRSISEITKFKVGKIKYNIRFVSLEYKDKTIKNIKSNVKHI